MNWDKLLSGKTFGMEDYQKTNNDNRTEFQHDYDRLIFSAPFRRLQNKTQVFSLPGSIFVHNRLTHSLEVACTGRSLGNSVSHRLQEKYGQNFSPFISEIGAIVSAACLAHDLGNPPFGHSGEKAIATFFSEGKGSSYKSQMTEDEWKDITTFEGNANAFRLLTHQFKGKRKGGFVLTYSTLAAIAKYPYLSKYAPANKQKFGFFISEKDDFAKIAKELGMIEFKKYCYARHPLVYLVEAADDICYEIMDIEDAHKLRILTYDETKELLFGFIAENRKAGAEKVLKIVSDRNEQIAYLRSIAIGTLVDACVNVFVENEQTILEGNFSGSLIQHMSDDIAIAYKNCENVSFKKIYHSKEVADVEVAGYNIIYTLMEQFSDAIINQEKAYSKILLSHISPQYEIEAPTTYGKMQTLLDFISGMTDVYALDIYQKINGFRLPTL